MAEQNTTGAGKIFPQSILLTPHSTEPQTKPVALTEVNEQRVGRTKHAANIPLRALQQIVILGYWAPNETAHYIKRFRPGLIHRILIYRQINI